ncbi:MAG: DnaJ C-terminal domain-containing protein [Oleiphilaceae bacterium]|nr:DnaJ C-terminal domain-containing protein [Oleiphilaceae bacterium]
MDFKDYYKILGVSEDADASQIKSAYRKLARKYHPDVSKEENAEERFKDVSEAYEVLKDSEKRAEYDQLRRYGQSGGDFQPPPGWRSSADFSGGGFTGAGEQGFSDFFESIFGAGGFQRGQSRAGPGFRGGRGFSARGEDIHNHLSIFLEEAYQGCEKTLKLQVPEPGPGGGQRVRERNLKVKVPAGVEHGKHIRLRGQGNPGVGDGPPGDLFLEIRIAPHPHFKLDGRHLHLLLPVAPWEAALGATVAVPTLGGTVNLKVPAGSRQGKKLRLKGKGLPGNPAGDQIVQLEVAMPPKQTERSKELFRALSEEVPFNPREHLGV